MHRGSNPSPRGKQKLLFSLFLTTMEDWGIYGSLFDNSEVFGHLRSLHND